MPHLRKIIYRDEKRSHRFLPGNTINVYAEGHRGWFNWAPVGFGSKSYEYPTKVPGRGFKKSLEEKFGERVTLIMKSDYMQLVFESDEDAVMFVMTFL